MQSQSSLKRQPPLIFRLGVVIFREIYGDSNSENRVSTYYVRIYLSGLLHITRVQNFVEQVTIEQGVKEHDTNEERATKSSLNMCLDISFLPIHISPNYEDVCYILESQFLTSVNIFKYYTDSFPLIGSISIGLCHFHILFWEMPNTLPWKFDESQILRETSVQCLYI